MSRKNCYLFALSSVKEPINDEPMFWSWDRGGWASLPYADFRQGDPAQLPIPNGIGTEVRWISEEEAMRLRDAWAAKQQARDKASFDRDAT